MVKCHFARTPAPSRYPLKARTRTLGWHIATSVVHFEYIFKFIFCRYNFFILVSITSGLKLGYLRMPFKTLLSKGYHAYHPSFQR